MQPNNDPTFQYIAPPPPSYSLPPQKPKRKLTQKGRQVIIGAIVVALILIIGNARLNQAKQQAATTPTVGATEQPTSEPSPQPTVRLSTEQQAIQLASTAAPSASKQTAKIDSSGGLTLTEFRDIVSVTTVKTDCYNTLRAIWQAKLVGINDVTLQINAQNDAGTVGEVGECSVSHSLDWGSLDYRSAWNQYDTMFVFPTLPQ